MIVLAMRTDKPEAELYIYDIEEYSSHNSIPREEQPEQKSHFLPGAMRNPERVFYRPKATVKWQAHLQLAETLNSKIEEILNMLSISYKELDGVAIYKGPGSFTGLRIGMSVANALAYSLDIPIVTKSGDDWIKQSITSLKSGKNDKIATPKYGSPAHITKPKK
jgi:tRNA threonylcarbamoyladenosine biosynthesis protein TsaB